MSSTKSQRVARLHSPPSDLQTRAKHLTKCTEGGPGCTEFCSLGGKMGLWSWGVLGCEGEDREGNGLLGMRSLEGSGGGVGIWRSRLVLSSLEMICA